MTIHVACVLKSWNERLQALEVLPVSRIGEGALEKFVHLMHQQLNITNARVTLKSTSGCAKLIDTQKIEAGRD